MMKQKALRKFFISIILPSILAILLFIMSIFLIIIPVFEKGMMERKKEMISELTHTAWSLIEEYYQDYQDSIYSLEKARELAASKVELMRYGDSGKDYFWITDMQPLMVMHPYRTELNGKDLSDYKDPEGVRLFVEAVNKVQENGEGFINYMWQWKDDSSRIVPKLSYVKAFPEWNWIVGTGIYLEDVKSEIKSLRGRLLRVSFMITLLIAVLLFLIVRQSLHIDFRRNEAEKKLKLSRERYKSLVEASSEGTLMMQQGQIIFSNQKFNKLTGCSGLEIKQKSFDGIFDASWDDIVSGLDNSDTSVSLETSITCSAEPLEVVLSVSRVKFSGEEAFIIVCKEIATHQKIEKGTEQLTQELQTALSLMNQPINQFVQDVVSCPMNESIARAVDIMTRKDSNVIFVSHGKKIMGVVNDSDLKKRVLAKGVSSEDPVSDIMTAPVKSLPEKALLYEAVWYFNKENISHLAVTNSSGDITGVIGKEEIFNMQRNALSFLIHEISQAEHVVSVKKVYDRVPVIVSSLLESGARTKNITHIISSLADAITIRLIELAIEELGSPPCDFAFIAMGSEGRMEQTLATDQDNAIILEDTDKGDAEILGYFADLAKKVNKQLDEVGYHYCDGDVMAQNPKWLQNLPKWKEYFTSWINDGDPQSLMDLSIFFDFRCIYGKKELVDELREHVNLVSQDKAVFLQHLAQSIIKIKMPGLGSGGILGSDDEAVFDIKKVLLPVLGFTRIYALKHQLHHTNTLERLDQLLHMKVLTKALYDELILAYDYLMLLRFKSQSNKISNRTEPDNQIQISKLTDIEKSTLKKIFSEISEIQTKLSFDFKGMV